MPISMSRAIYCKNCKGYIKTEFFGDALTSEDLIKLQHSICRKCRGSLLHRIIKTFKD